MTGWQLFGHQLLQNELWEKRVRSLSVICRFNKNFIWIGYWYFTTWISGVVGKLRLSQREGGARPYSRLNLTVLGPPHSPHPSLFPSSLSLSFSFPGLLVQLHPDDRASRTNEPTSGARFAAATALATAFTSHRPRHARYGTAAGNVSGEEKAYGNGMLRVRNHGLIWIIMAFSPCLVAAQFQVHEKRGLLERGEVVPRSVLRSIRGHAA